MADVGKDILSGATRETLVTVIASVPVFVYVPDNEVGAPAMMLSTNAVTVFVSLCVDVYYIFD